MKKLLTLVLALVMVLSMASFASAAEEPLVLQFWHTGNAGGKLYAVDYAMEKFNSTIGAEKNIRVEGSFIGGYDELMAKIQLSVQANEQPQIAIFANTHVGWAVDDDLVVDMMPFAVADGFDVSNIMDPFMLAMGNRDGELKTVPFFRSTPMLYYNKTMADEAGLTPPTTMAELEDFAKALYKTDANGEIQVWGFECLKDFSYYNGGNIWQLGSMLINEDATEAPCLEDGAMLEVLTTWRRWVDEGWCRPFDATTDQAALMKEQFYQGKLACFWESCGSLTGIMEGAEAGGFELGVMPFTTFDIEKPITQIGGGNVGIIGAGNTDEQIAASWEFIKVLMSDDCVTYTSMVTGYVPVTKSVQSFDGMQEYWAENPMAKVAYDQLSTAYPQEFPYVPFLQDFVLVCQDATSLMLQDKSLTPEEALEYIKTNSAYLF